MALENAWKSWLPVTRARSRTILFRLPWLRWQVGASRLSARAFAIWAAAPRAFSEACPTSPSRHSALACCRKWRAAVRQPAMVNHALRSTGRFPFSRSDAG